MRLAVSLVLVSTAAFAEADHFGFGDGHHGACCAVGAARQPVSTALLESVSSGANTLKVATGVALAPGDLVLIHQSTRAVSFTATTGLLDLSSDGVGTFEFARLESYSPSLPGFTLTAPLVHAFTSPGAQVVQVLEFTTLSLPVGSALRPAPWNGSAGGVLAVLATQSAAIDGALSANGAGFRGASPVTDLVANQQCDRLISPQPLCAPSGESFSSGTPLGAQSWLTGGGGGCCLAGSRSGGGGGLGGRGGKNGSGGEPGGAVSLSPTLQVLFGGGGGASHSTQARPGAAGGSGGGVVLVRAPRVSGAGVISADGESTPGTDQSGGGAGGTVQVRTTTGIAVASISATGGAAGARADCETNGAAGGGGLVFLQGAVDVSTVVRASGPRPASCATSEATDGATTVLATPFGSLKAPALISPTEGSIVSVHAAFSGHATPGATVHVQLDDTTLLDTVADSEGSFAVAPDAPLAEGAHTVRAQLIESANESEWTELVHFQASSTVSVGQPFAHAVSCSCGSVEGSFLLGVVALLSRQRRNRARSR